MADTVQWWLLAECGGNWFYAAVKSNCNGSYRTGSHLQILRRSGIRRVYRSTGCCRMRNLRGATTWICECASPLISQYCLGNINRLFLAIVNRTNFGRTMSSVGKCTSFALKDSPRYWIPVPYWINFKLIGSYDTSSASNGQLIDASVNLHFTFAKRIHVLCYDSIVHYNVLLRAL